MIHTTDYQNSVVFSFTARKWRARHRLSWQKNLNLAIEKGQKNELKKIGLFVFKMKGNTGKDADKNDLPASAQLGPRHG